MLLVMDESGDPGLVIPPGQSPWFVIAGVLFTTREDGQACRVALTDFRRAHGGRELHFTKTADKRRRQVLEVLTGCPFRYYAVACDKSKLEPGRWRKPADLRHALVGRLVGRVAPLLTDCTVWFDTLGGRTVDSEYGRHVRHAAGKLPNGRGRVADCRPRDSGKELLIQVADYVCGAVARSFRPGRDEGRYLRLIAGREAGLIVWPGSDSDSVEKEDGSPERPVSE
jgi:hypothetical protein